MGCRVGVFPEREEILVGGECPDSGGIGIRSCEVLDCKVFARATPRCANAPVSSSRRCAVVENLLKLGSSSAALSGCQVCLSASIHRIEAEKIAEHMYTLARWVVRQLAGHSGGSRILPVQRQLRLNRRQQSDCIWVSSGKRFPKSCAKDSALAVSPPWRTQARLRSRHSDSSEQASKPLPLTVALPLRSRKRLP